MEARHAEIQSQICNGGLPRNCPRGVPDRPMGTSWIFGVHNAQTRRGQETGEVGIRGQGRQETIQTLCGKNRPEILPEIRPVAGSVCWMPPHLRAIPHRFLRPVFLTTTFPWARVFFPAFAFFSTRSFHDVRNAPSSTSSLAAASRICVIPILPHPPAMGTNTSGISPTNTACCSGVSRVPHPLRFCRMQRVGGRFNSITTQTGAIRPERYTVTNIFLDTFLIIRYTVFGQYCAPAHRGFFISNSILGDTYVLSSPTGPQVLVSFHLC